jgi:hypothetical protein
VHPLLNLVAILFLDEPVWLRLVLGFNIRQTTILLFSVRSVNVGLISMVILGNVSSRVTQPVITAARKLLRWIHGSGGTLPGGLSLSLHARIIHRSNGVLIALLGSGSSMLHVFRCGCNPRRVVCELIEVSGFGHWWLPH